MTSTTPRADRDAAAASLEGKSTTFEKIVSTGDVENFALLSGDDHPIHIDEAFARRAGLDGRIVQGSLLVGLMAGASTKFFREIGRPALSYGYDRVRFTGQVRLRERLTVDYRIEKHDLTTRKTIADVKVFDRSGTLVAVARHIALLIG